MKTATSWTTETGPSAISLAYKNLVEQLGSDPTLIILFCSIAFDIDDVMMTLRSEAPQVPLHGGTSCLGVMTQDGIHVEDNQGLAMFGILDPEGRYGVGVAKIGNDPGLAARQATQSALEMADCPGEVPSLVWMTAAPGHEEALILGISDLLGEDVPIIGGSSADNLVQGDWKQFTNHETDDNAILVTTMFPSTEVMFAFHSGYEPTDQKGTVTQTGSSDSGSHPEGNNRILREIDNRPAAQVYNEWSQGQISDWLEEGGNILGSTALNPLGRVAGLVGDIPYYQLSHPKSVSTDGSLEVFTDLNVGDEIVMMSGTENSLVSRAGRVALSALETHSARPEDVAGALVVYCAGCMLKVQDRLDEVVDSLRTSLPTTPFLGMYTFGEQGCFLGGENRHGNLMISVLLFSNS